MIRTDGSTEVGQALSHFLQEVQEFVGTFTAQALKKFNGASKAPIGHIVLQNDRLL